MGTVKSVQERVEFLTVSWSKQMFAHLRFRAHLAEAVNNNVSDGSDWPRAASSPTFMEQAAKT